MSGRRCHQLMSVCRVACAMSWIIHRGCGTKSGMAIEYISANSIIITSQGKYTTARRSANLPAFFRV